MTYVVEGTVIIIVMVHIDHRYRDLEDMTG